MASAEHTMKQSVQTTWYTRVARSSLLALLDRLPQGQLIVKEHGIPLAKFGQDSSELQAEIDVLDWQFYPKLLLGGSVAAGETFVEGWWRTPDLTAVIRLFARNMPLLDELEARLGWLLAPLTFYSRLRLRNSKNQARQNISAHYDLGNALYSRFLDSSMMYSAAIYPNPAATLAQAQQHKLRTICEKLALTADDHLLEIGTGWGGLAVFAARHYGCRVTTTTISEEQYQYSRELFEREGLAGKITLLKQDYRELQGQYDKLVSIEMIEAVGKEYLPTFFSKCNSLLKEDGLMLLQSITIAEHRMQTYAKGQDFIQKHIFPGGFLPSVSLLAGHLAQYTDMLLRDCHDTGLHYARTLQDWHRNLLERKQALSKFGYDERFIRLWSFYFCYCEGGFLERTISTVQLLMTKPGYRYEIQRC
ncbi:SAM-dependent methyltransferase [Bowmanella dokdonensis]|uniref:Class I SAM-dependent methyltransferase n=1 Tax=Bowmanella dokdonensis TaxID=751969 RepID=A0A939DQY0_9ALTE|nr:cyclopropane-fatty-acyl-phospholipid synthase family protein [Bowmanella dokdonensis]MBN7827109.1 class I SAM-dependent methyltransferase [Bowmanella dokdonensis]